MRNINKLQKCKIKKQHKNNYRLIKNNENNHNKKSKRIQNIEL